MFTEESRPLSDGSWESNFKIHSYEADFTTRASLPALFRFMQEAAWQHASHHQIGYADLIENNQVWVLTGITVQLSQTPFWEDSIKVKTWARGTDRLFALRDFTFFNAKNEKFINAKSHWIVVNVETKRPQRLDPFLNKMPLVEEKAIEETFHSVCNFTESVLLEHRKVRVSDVDVYGHMNNTRYIEWVTDTFSSDDYANLNISFLEVHFLKEALPDSDLTIWKQQKDNMLYFAIKDKSGKLEHCRIILTTV